MLSYRDSPPKLDRLSKKFTIFKNYHLEGLYRRKPREFVPGAKSFDARLKNVKKYLFELVRKRRHAKEITIITILSMQR